MTNKKTFSDFTNLYSLSKTLRFELKPVGKTLENMRNRIYKGKNDYDPELQTFLHDQEIENAYQKLKPLFDAIHEEFITDSLILENTENINFSNYLEKYREKKDLKESEKTLRDAIGKTFIKAGEKWKSEKYPQYEWKKGSNVANGANILLSQDVLQLIKDSHQEDKEIKKIVDETFKGFFTYFGGFNQNRENYYTTNEEKATAIATRIVHENLPKFCDNLLQFEAIIKKKKDGSIEKIERKQEYLDAYQYLKKQGKITQIKDAETGKMIEAESISENIFMIFHFSSRMSQSGIEGYNRTIGHYNLLINLYNQAKENEEKDLKKSEKTFKRLPIFKTLYKQIGCGKKKVLFFTLTHNRKVEAEQARKDGKETFSVEEVLSLAKQAGDNYFKGKSEDGIINTVQEFLDYISTKENYEGVYWSKAALNTISGKYFANYHDLKDRLKAAKVFQKANKGSEDDVKIPEVVELQGLFEVLDETDDWKSEGIFFRKNLTEERKNEEENIKNKKRRDIITEAEKPSKALLNLILTDINEQMEEFLATADSILKLTEYKSEKSKEVIKTWMDHALAVHQMLKYFLVKENKAKKDSPIDPIVSEALKFLLFECKIDLDNGVSENVDWFKWYDSLRNYLTKKPQADVKENKLKLNFENSTLAGGWDVNKEKNNFCIILLDQEGKQYLAIIAKQDKQKGYNKIFEKTPDNPVYKIDNGEIWRKMEYKQIAAPTGIGGFVRKCFNTAQQYGWKCPDNCLNSEGKIIIKNDEAKANLKTIIDCHKDFFNKYEKDGFKYKNFSFNFKESGKYKELNNFFGDVEKQGYKLSFAVINKIIIDQWVDEGKVYLFEIKNQDTNNGKQEGHKNNLHTMYWKELFEDIENKPKLSGGAELFYRKALLQEKQEKIQDKHGNEVIKNFRFSKEKFLFHCPIKINYKAKSYSDPKYALPEINKTINEHLSSNPNLHFLGIDRGEKHLAYYSLVNTSGKIIDQGTLNLPFTDKDGKRRSIKKEKYSYDKTTDEWKPEEVDCWDYNGLLEALASNRDMARKNWKTIGTIKELKEGYISQVIHKIAKLATNDDSPTFIVLEDLNTRFKIGRQKIEKSVYQKFELALAKKLNFLVDKSAKNGEIGSVTKALQLTPPVNNYGDIENRKQVGIMLYTRANYTSQTDPHTGWRKTIYLQHGPEETTYTKDGKVKNKSIKDQIIETFDDILVKGKDYVFIYKDKKTGKTWKLYSGINGESLTRFRGRRGQDKYEWIMEKQDIVEILDVVFSRFDKEKSLLEQIKSGIQLTKPEGEKYAKYTAWESLHFAIDLIQQIRNTGKEKRDSDFILSPVRDENSKNGKHFDSREYWDQEQQGQKVDMPTSGDANGAYNIARKGFIMNEHIRVWKENGEPKYDKNTSDLNLFISDQEWDLYLADKENWRNKLSIFSSRKLSEQIRE